MEKDDSDNHKNELIKEKITNSNEEILENEEEFISLINKLLQSEFEELFTNILNLPKIDFLGQLTSSVSFILSGQFSSEKLQNSKYASILNNTYHSFDKTYNKYMDELSEGWDKYNFEKMNTKEQNLDSYYFTNFRKHCIKTQNLALHLCNSNNQIGNFIIVYSNKSTDNNKKVKYLICEKCRKCYFVHEFLNYCEFCKITYLCSKLGKEEDGNYLPATFVSPHCENFINKEIRCEFCNNILYIDIKNSKLKCNNRRCTYSTYIDEQKKLSFKCTVCHNKFFSTIKIYNPIEVIHFKNIISKALLNKKKASPGKIYCCQKMKEKKTDFFHKKNCKGKLYLAEYNNKLIIVCSLCKAVNLYNNYIWICPECGIHFRDKKSEENEKKIRKTKSLNKLTKSNTIKSEDSHRDNYLTVSGHKKQNGESYSRRNTQNEIKNLFLDTEINNYNTENGYFDLESQFFSNTKLEKLDVRKEYKKIKKNYLFRKILPFCSSNNKYNEEDNSENNKDDNNDDSENKKQNMFKYNSKSGRIHFNNNNKNENININDFESKENNDINLIKRMSQNIDNICKIEINNKISDNQNEEHKNSIDIINKRFTPIRLKYLNKKKTQDNKIEDNMNTNNNTNTNDIKINLKKDSINQISNNNKESWQSKDTTAKDSVESKNSIISKSPPKCEEENIKNINKEVINKTIQNTEDENDDIISPEKINPDLDIPIADENIKEGSNLYAQIQRRLKKILKKGKLPRFDLDKFSIEKQIGDGSFGIIYSVYNVKSNRKYAMKKIIANNLSSLEFLQNEFEIAYQSHHPCILDIKGIYIKCYDATTFALYVLMDLAERDWEVEINERQKTKNFYSEKELINILKQLSNALYFLQKEKGVAHRDIKPENVLIFKNNKESNFIGDNLYKICDFGEAKNLGLVDKGRNKTIRGTELYMSPLLYDGLAKDAEFVAHDAYKSDMFSLGCCIIVAASLNFDIINEIRNLKEQMKITKFLKRRLLGKYNEKLVDILLKMINFNEKERIDFVQLEQMLKDTF